MWYNEQEEGMVLDRKGRSMANKGSSLATGAYLATNDYLVSANGLYFVIMQGDGNLVIYHGSDPAHQGAFVWNSGVAPGIGQYFVIMQRDGNLCIYHGSDPAHQGAFVWNSGKAPGAGVYVATMQNDGNLVVTTGTTVVWSAQQLSPSSQPPAGHSNLISVGDQDFQSKVLSSQTLVIVDFWASWAGECLRIAPLFERLSDAYQGKMLFAKLDIDANPQTPRSYNVLSVPTLVIFRDGQELDRMVGSYPSAALKHFIDPYIAT
jgi:thioredoxin